MHHSQLSSSLPDASNDQFDSPEFVTNGYRSAIERLQGSFEACCPVATVMGEGQSATSFVVGRFLATLDSETSVARISKPCANADDFMRQIVQGVGFDPKDMGVEDLQSILRMFLSFQKSHGRRTVICLEQIQDSEWWVLDRIRHFVKLEARGNFGMMLILSGQPRLQELLHTRPLSAINLAAGQRISLAPFTLEETTEYIRRRVLGTTRKSIDQAFHYQAITLIHEISAGVPDVISSLLDLCFDRADQAGIELITSDLVHRAHRQGDDIETETTVNLNGLQPQAGRLVIAIDGEQLREMVVSHGHILLGRSKLCDIRIASKTVSRYHALISYTPDGVMLADLSSTNGTSVDGHRIDQHCLAPGETITLGDCRIEYLADDKQHAGIAVPDMPSARVRPRTAEAIGD